MDNNTQPIEEEDQTDNTEPDIKAVVIQRMAPITWGQLRFWTADVMR